MPQMAPLSWLTLFSIFSLTLILFNTLNYYSFEVLPPSSLQASSKMTNSFNWQW